MVRMMGLKVCRVLLIINTCLFILSAIRPWWIATFQPVLSPETTYVWIYAYGLIHNAKLLAPYLASYETSPTLMTLAKVVLAAFAILSISSLFIKSKWGPRLVGVIGFIYLVWSLGFIPVIYEGTGRAPVPGERFPVQGQIRVRTDVEDLIITASFQDGYLLAIISSIIFISLFIWRELAYRRGRGSKI